MGPKMRPKWNTACEQQWRMNVLKLESNGELVVGTRMKGQQGGGWTHSPKQEHGSLTTDDEQVDADESGDGGGIYAPGLATPRNGL
jgi:hypothetical protein